MASVRIERIEIGGWEPPHSVKIELVGKIDKLVDDETQREIERRKGEFARAVAAAFEGILLAGRDASAPRTGPATIEDIEL